MNTVRNWINRYFAPLQPLTAGVYQYQAPPEAQKPYRLHLRLDPDGKGLLILNARTVLHLNPTGAEFAYYLIKQMAEVDIAKEVSKRYRVSREHALADYQGFASKINSLLTTEDVDPEAFFQIDRQEPYSTKLSAPLRIDCALTYKLGEDMPEKIAPTDRVKREMLSEEWKTILDKAWAAGIPHVVFTGGEPTLRPDLVDLILYTEKLGMVSGVLTNGLRLADPKYLHEILQAGLDHIMLLLDPDDEASWEALRDTLTEDIFVTAHLTITKKNVSRVEKIFDRLQGMGVKSLSISANNLDLKQELKDAQQSAANHQLSLVWDLPVPYSKYHPLSLELAEGEQPAEGAGNAWIYVEPDGDVLPGQGIEKVLGNMLTDPWEQIWKKTG